MLFDDKELEMRARTPATLLTAGVLTLALAGCFSNPLEQIVQGGAEGLVEQISGGNVDVGLGGSASIPDDFPADIPLPPGSPTLVVSHEGTVQLTYAVDGSSTAEALVDDLAAAGFSETSHSDMGTMTIWIYGNDAYTVGVTLMESDGDDTLGILVSTRD